MGIEHLFVGEDDLKDEDASPSPLLRDDQEIGPSRPLAREPAPAEDFSSLTKLAILITLLCIYAGYYTYQRSEAETLINTTITSNDDLERGLVLHYTLDGPNIAWGSTTAEVLDSSPSSIDGDTVNLDPESVVGGKIGQALNFNGSAARIVSASTTGPASQTIAAWVWLSTTTKNQAIVTKDNGGSMAFQVEYGGGLTVLNWFHTGGSSSHIASQPDLTPNRWHHVVATYAQGGAGDVAIYVDGVSKALLDSTESTPPPTIDSPFVIGGRIDGTLPFDGRMDDVRIYDRALSASEARRLYELGGASHVNETITTNDDIERGLVGHWTFDGPDMAWGSTTAEVLDSSSSTHSLSGDAVNIDRTSVVSGKIGQGLRFNGLSSYISIPDRSSLRPGNESFTMSAWAKPDDLDQMASIIAKRDTGGEFEQYNMIICNSSTGCNAIGKHFQAVFRANTSSSRISKSVSPVIDGNWHHFVAVADKVANQIVLYMDGNIISYTSVTAGAWPTVDNTNALEIGSSGAGSNKFIGAIDDVRLYSRALSASEVKRLYDLGATTHINTTIETNDGLERGLVGHWTFDGPKMSWISTTAEVLDSSPSSIEGDLSNMSQQSVAIGKIGQAMQFSGDDSAVTMPATACANIATKTVAAWIKPRSLGTSNSGAIVDKNWSIAMHDGNRVRVSQSFSGGWGYWDAPENTIPLDRWTHVAYSYDRSTTTNDPRIYVNGELVSVTEHQSPSGTASSDSDSILRIGNSEFAISDFDGLIDDVRVYNRILSRAEVRRLYELGGGH